MRFSGVQVNIEERGCLHNSLAPIQENIFAISTAYVCTTVSAIADLYEYFLPLSPFMRFGMAQIAYLPPSEPTAK